MAQRKCISNSMKKHWIQLLRERTLNLVRSRFAKFADIPWKEKHRINVHCAMSPETNLLHSNKRFLNHFINKIFSRFLMFLNLSLDALHNGHLSGASPSM